MNLRYLITESETSTEEVIRLSETGLGMRKARALLVNRVESLQVLIEHTWTDVPVVKKVRL